MDSLLKSVKIYLCMWLMVAKKEITTEFFEAESRPKIQFLLLRIEHCFFRIIFPVVESNLVKRIQNLWNWIKFHTILFCFVELCCICSICGNISLYWNFCYGSANFYFRKLKTSFLLVFLVFFFLILLKYKFLYGYFSRILHG